MSLVRRWLGLRHLILAVILTGAALGAMAYFRLPVNLFPDSERPQAAVVTVWPGAAAADVEADLTRVIERELAGLELVRQVSSTSRDEVSSVTVEFTYDKDLDVAGNDVAGALDRIAGSLPATIRPPMLFKVSSATPAVLTIALAPAPGSHLDLSMIRQIADNPIRDRLLQLSEVARVEVFGGHRPVARVRVDPVRLAAHGLSVGDVSAALAGRAGNQPLGQLRGFGEDVLLVRLDARATAEELEEIVIAGRGAGTLRLRDVAEVERGVEDPVSAFHADGEPAIALNVQRATTGNAVRTVEAVAAVLPELRRDYPAISFSVPDNQGDLITLSLSNMKSSLVGAIVPTMLVLFLFLGDRRVTLLAGVSLPLTFLLTFTCMWLLGMEFNLVTLTAIIVAVGMVVDNSVVVIENIVRHARERREGIDEAAITGTSQVALAIFGGTATTVMVLVPVLFIGGFVETILRPFAATLILAILSSYLVAVTIIPLLAPRLLRDREGDQPRGRWDRIDALAGRAGEAVTGAVASVALRASGWALRHRGIVLLVAATVLVVSVAQMPVLGRDLMSPMDSGIVKISFDAAPNTPFADVEELLDEVEAIVLARPGVESMAAVLGSEPDVISLGAGRTYRQGIVTVHLVNRFERDQDIWRIEDALAEEIRALPGLVNVSVYDYGATPFSSIKATVDVELSGPDPQRLHALGQDVERRLRAGVRGITSVSTSWRSDTRQLVLRIDPERAARHGTTPEAVSAQLSGLLRGDRATVLRLPSQTGLPVLVQLPAESRSTVERLEGIQLATPTGPTSLSALATIQPVTTADLITHRDLVRTLDITATRARRPVTHLQEDVDAALQGLELPAGYRLQQRGEIHQMRESFGRLGQALLIALILLYGVLVPIFRSWSHPLTVMTAIPLAAVGSIWALMLVGKPGSMPAFMGIILLGGVAVNNSILVLDFLQTARREGMSRGQAIRQAIRLRTRPILVTALSTLMGMLPVALELAVGLERLSPLAIVSIGGLVLSSFLVLVFVPVVATLLEDTGHRIRGWLGAVTPAPTPRSSP